MSKSNGCLKADDVIVNILRRWKLQTIFSKNFVNEAHKYLMLHLDAALNSGQKRCYCRTLSLLFLLKCLDRINTTNKRQYLSASFYLSIDMDKTFYFVKFWESIIFATYQNQSWYDLILILRLTRKLSCSLSQIQDKNQRLDYKEDGAYCHIDLTKSLR